jgi:23S rRNA (adenine2503-C2)-methyltransferase
MGCTFCATGQFGFTRQLSAGEVVEQVARVSTMLPELRPGPQAPDHLTNVVFMGMGEPFANPAATWGAAWRLHRGFGLSARAITISTVGLVPGIRRAAPGQAGRLHPRRRRRGPRPAGAGQPELADRRAAGRCR